MFVISEASLVKTDYFGVSKKRSVVFFWEGGGGNRKGGPVRIAYRAALAVHSHFHHVDAEEHTQLYH